jgi:hypothetical protein
MPDQDPVAISRRAALAGLGIATVGVRGVRLAAAQSPEPERAVHPIVGAWLTMNPGDPPSASPVSFTADGIMTVAYAPSFVDPDQGVLLQGPAIGSWEPTGDRSLRFTFVQALSNLDGTYRGTFTLNGFPVVSDDGLSFVDDGTQASVALRDATNAIVFQAGGGQGAAPITPPVQARRLRVGDPGFPEAAMGPATASPSP